MNPTTRKHNAFTLVESIVLILVILGILTHIFVGIARRKELIKESQAAAAQQAAADLEAAEQKVADARESVESDLRDKGGICTVLAYLVREGKKVVFIVSIDNDPVGMSVLSPRIFLRLESFEGTPSHCPFRVLFLLTQTGGLPENVVVHPPRGDSGRDSIPTVDAPAGAIAIVLPETPEPERE